MNSYSVLISKHYFQNLQMQNWSIFILLKMHQESQKWEWRFLTFRLQYKCLYGNYMYEAIKSTAMEFSLYNVACCQSYHICCNISYLCSRATSQLALKTHTYSEMHTHTHRHTGTHTDTLAKSIIFSLTWQTSTPEPLCGMRVFHPAKSWFQNLCIKLHLLFLDVKNPKVCLQTCAQTQLCSTNRNRVQIYCSSSKSDFHLWTTKTV